MRYVLGLPPRGHVGQNELNKTAFLKVENGITKLSLNHIFKVKVVSSPYYFNDMLTEMSNVHKFNKIQDTVVSISVYQLLRELPQTVSFSQVTKLWNNLPKELTCIQNYKSFNVK